MQPQNVTLSLIQHVVPATCPISSSLFSPLSVSYPSPRSTPLYSTFSLCPVSTPSRCEYFSRPPVRIRALIAWRSVIEAIDRVFFEMDRLRETWCLGREYFLGWKYTGGILMIINCLIFREQRLNRIPGIAIIFFFAISVETFNFLLFQINFLNSYFGFYWRLKYKICVKGVETNNR